jgi:Flp pilus assembly pilin Flp
MNAKLRQLLQDERGAMLTEYVTVTGFVALLTIPALLYCGVQLANSFVFVRSFMLYPFP